MPTPRPTTPLLAILLSCPLGGTALAAPSAPYYEADDPNPAPLGYPDPTLLATLKQQLARQKVASVKNLTSGVADVDRLSRSERVAVLYMASGKPGAEMDVLVEEKGQYVPFELFWDGDAITFHAGAPRAELYGKASSKEDIQKKYGVGAFVDDGSSWDNNALYVVETALAALKPAELAGVAGLPFHRMQKDPRLKAVRGTAIAMYVPDLERIEVYDQGFEADKRRFSGTVEKPTPASVGAVIHECAHAFSRREARELRREAVTLKAAYDDVNGRIIEGKKKYDEERATFARTKDPQLGKSISEHGKALQALVPDMNAKGKRFQEVSARIVAVDKQGSTLERSYNAKVPFQKSPTTYGRTAMGESFADSLALFKLDRAALERAAPGAPAWFESPEYNALLQPANP